MQIKDQNIYTWLSLISSRRGFGQWASFLVVRGGTSFEKQFGVGVGTPISDPNGQKTNGFSSKSTANTPDLKTSAGYGRSRGSYLGNFLSELRSDQTQRSYSFSFFFGIFV
jgi:hypothetical protein